MKIKINESSYVINFIGVGYDFDMIRQRLENELKILLEKIEFSNDLEDWTLEFSILYNNVKNLGIARKSKSAESLKLKEVKIHLPIPTIEIVSWGVEKNQLINEISFDKRYIDEMEVDIQKYSNRKGYISENARKGILFALTAGITINGKDIKIENKATI